LALLAFVLVGLPAAAVVSGECVQARGGNSCTAGDVTFILVGLGIQDDGCVNSSDTLTIRMGGQLQNTAASTRYDIGMYVFNGLTGSLSAYSGASCARETLKPVGALNDNTCGAGHLDLAGGSGPFLNTDGDSCGELAKHGSNGGCEDSFMIFPEPITVQCADGNGGTDGFVDIATCATWGQNADDIGTGGVCSSESDVLPGTPSKCNCGIVNSDVPRPALSLGACTCSPSTVRSGAGLVNGASTTCSVAFTNSVTCTPDSSTAERFRCGAASFLQFDTVASSAAALGSSQFLSSSSPSATPTETTGGTISVPSANTINWTPRDTVATGGGTGLGIIGHNETGTLTFQYFVAPAVASGSTISFTTTGYWANDSSFSTRVAQSALTSTCSITTSNLATWARVSAFDAREEDGEVVLRWETAGEVGTTSFVVERRDAGGRWVAVAGAVPALGQLPGGRYRLLDPDATAGKRLTYRLVEIDSRGARELLGPYTVTVGRARAPKEPRTPFSAAARAVSPRLLTDSSARRAAGALSQVSAAEPADGKPARRARVTVAETGLVRVALRDAALALGLPTPQVAALQRAGRLRLSHGAVPVSWEPAADGDGIVFYAPGITSPYTVVDAFWLEVGDGELMAPLTVGAPGGSGAPSFTDTAHAESDVIPAVTAALPVDDFWIWKSMFPGFPGFDRGVFGISAPAPAAGLATLGVQLYGLGGHQRARLRFNGDYIGELAWDGAGAVTPTVKLPAGLVHDGFNEVELTVLEAPRGFWVDSFDLTYEHLFQASGDRLTFRAGGQQAIALAGFSAPDITVYDLAQPLQPRRLAGLAAAVQVDGSWGVRFEAPEAGTYLATRGKPAVRAVVQASAPADLLDPAAGAEYLVIAPRELRREAQRLADLRAAGGLSTLVVDVDDVMDLFAEGVYDPPAIRRFLAYAVEHWPTAPRYVALAGRGSYDYRNLLGLWSNKLPTLLVETPDGLAPADSTFADFAGTGVPAVAIGRIPAVTAAELHAYVDKLMAYDSAPAGSWTHAGLLVADDADEGGPFPADSAALAARLGTSLDLSRIDLPAGATGGQQAASRAELFSALRGGVGLFNYVGHGGLDRLANEGLLTTADVRLLGNAPRLPVMTALTCLIAQFAYPTVSSLGEELVLQPDGGAVALFGPTWLSHDGAANQLGGYLLPELAAASGGRLGDRVLRGLAAYAAAGGDPQTLRVYTLLGDPAIIPRR
jgi:hypothetical protein